MHRDLNGKDVAWYRFTETPGKVYGPKDMAFVFRAYGDRSTCEVTGSGEDGDPSPVWFPATALRARLKSQALQPAQRRRLLALGVDFDESTLDKGSARDLIEQAELQQPASAAAIEDARARGAKVLDGMTVAALNRALIPIEEAEDAIEEEQDRRAELAYERARITRHGIAVDEAISEEELQLLNDEWESYEFAVEQAREWDLSPEWIKAHRPRNADDLRRVTSLLEAYTEDARTFDAMHLTLALKLEQAPSDAAMRRVRQELLKLREGGAGRAEIEALVIEALKGAAPQKPVKQADSPVPPISPRKSREQQNPTVVAAQERGARRSAWPLLLLVGFVVAMLLIAQAITTS